jgi:hypothetical protein
VGYYGNSYAIPTKDENIKTMPLDEIRPYIGDFCNFVKSCPETEFNVTRIGCGLAGFKDQEIAPLFLRLTIKEDCQPKVWFDPIWKPYLGEFAKFWKVKQ